MNIYIVINSLFIAVGAIIILISIVKTKKLMNVLHFVPEHRRSLIRLYLLLHRTLMVFFLCGYLVVLAAFIFHYSFISETFVSIIFFFGSIFVYIGVSVQSRLLSEMQNTLQGILPICCKCKKIRSAGADQKDPQSWKKIEDFLTDKTKVNFSHGLCPECFENEMRELKSKKQGP